MIGVFEVCNPLTEASYNLLGLLAVWSFGCFLIFIKVKKEFQTQIDGAKCECAIFHIRR